MENLMLFYPLIVLLFFIFFDVIKRRKRPVPPVQKPADWQAQLPEERQASTDAAADDDMPWYVEFPEDREPKPVPVAVKHTYAGGGGQNVYLEEQQGLPAAAAEMPSEPLYKRFEGAKKPVFKGFRSRRTVADEVRRGFVMAQILDKPRSLKPYDDSL